MVVEKKIGLINFFPPYFTDGIGIITDIYAIHYFVKVLIAKSCVKLFV